MATNFKGVSITRLVYMAMIPVLAGLWSLTVSVNKNFKDLEVKSIERNNPVAKPLDAQTLYPVTMVKKGEAVAGSSDSSPDAVFGSQEIKKKEEAPKKVEAPPVNYDAEVRSRVSVDGLGTGGAYLNNEFVRIGESVPDASFSDRSAQIAPVLASVGSNSVVLRCGTRTVTLKIPATQ